MAGRVVTLVACRSRVEKQKTDQDALYQASSPLELWKPPFLQNIL